MSWFSRVIRKQPERRLGYLPDQPDPRDLALSIGQPVSGLPSSVDLRPAVLAVLDQGQTSSCVANAWAGAIDVCETLAGLEYSPASRLYIYYAARALDGMQTRDEGTYLRSGARALQLLGAPLERYWPFNAKKVNKQPLPEAYMRAHPRRDGVYERITGVGDIRLNKCRALLASGRPFVFGTLIANSFLNNEGTWRVQRPGKTTPIAGGHAMCCVGYDSDGFLVLNSWNIEWRDRGYIRLSDEYMAWSQTSDLWTIKSWRALKLAVPMMEVN